MNIGGKYDSGHVKIPQMRRDSFVARKDVKLLQNAGPTVVGL